MKKNVLLMLMITLSINFSTANKSEDAIRYYKTDKYVAWLSAQFGLINFAKNDVCKIYNIESKAYNSLIQKKKMIFEKGGELKNTWIKNENILKNNIEKNVLLNYDKEGKDYCLRYIPILDKMHFQEKKRLKPKI